MVLTVGQIGQEQRDADPGDSGFSPDRTILEGPANQMTNLRMQQEQRQEQLDQFAGQQEAQANMVADMFRQAGMANAADAFKRRQRAAIFEAARRGQRGSSIEQSRLNETQQQLRTDVAGVERDTAQVRSRGLLGAQGREQQFGQLALGANPMALLGNRLQAQSLQQQTRNLATMQGAQQDLNNVQLGGDLAQGQLLGNALSTLGTVGQGAILGYYNR